MPSFGQIYGIASIRIHSPNVGRSLTIGEKRDFTVGLPPASNGQPQRCQAGDQYGAIVHNVAPCIRL